MEAKYEVEPTPEPCRPLQSTSLLYTFCLTIDRFIQRSLHQHFFKTLALIFTVYFLSYPSCILSCNSYCSLRTCTRFSEIMQVLVCCFFFVMLCTGALRERASRAEQRQRSSTAAPMPC
ncbi:hypothetical protein BJX96DRAFT_156926 [Aspergillus floccosus]